MYYRATGTNERGSRVLICLMMSFSEQFMMMGVSAMAWQLLRQDIEVNWHRGNVGGLEAGLE